MFEPKNVTECKLESALLGHRCRSDKKSLLYNQDEVPKNYSVTWNGRSYCLAIPRFGYAKFVGVSHNWEWQTLVITMQWPKKGVTWTVTFTILALFEIQMRIWTILFISDDISFGAAKTSLTPGFWWESGGAGRIGGGIIPPSLGSG